MKSQPLENEQTLHSIINAKGISIIFKHNTTCPISKMAKIDLEEHSLLIPDAIQVYFLNLLRHRDISNAIATQFSVTHESPQVLLIKDGECVYHASLYDIAAEELANTIQSVA
ncbi:MAG: thioredoxin family protein [Daejeonella sp.]|nr:thioredoxin family protein [Daejeonella sp.]